MMILGTSLISIDEINKILVQVLCYAYRNGYLNNYTICGYISIFKLNGNIKCK